MTTIRLETRIAAPAMRALRVRQEDRTSLAGPSSSPTTFVPPQNLRHAIQSPRLGVLLHMFLPESLRELWRYKVLRPLLCLLRDGMTTRRMAWSLALGMVVGINPSVGITTVVVILIAWIFGLNQVASQIGTHVVAPFHLLLFIPFIEAGVFLFRTRHMPFDRQQIKHLSHHPLHMVHEIWRWQWHALVIWLIVAAILTPLLALYLRRLLVVLLRRHKTLIHSAPATDESTRQC